MSLLVDEMTRIQVTSACGYLAPSVLAMAEGSFSTLPCGTQAVVTGDHPQTEVSLQDLQLPDSRALFTLYPLWLQSWAFRQDYGPIFDSFIHSKILLGTSYSLGTLLISEDGDGDKPGLS